MAVAAQGGVLHDQYPIDLLCKMFPDVADQTEAAAADTGVIRIRVSELSQLFNTIDPSPFQERDLDNEAERFIVSWARDVPSCAPLSLQVELSHQRPTAAE